MLDYAPGCVKVPPRPGTPHTHKGLMPCRCSTMRPAASRCPPSRDPTNPQGFDVLQVLDYALGCVKVPPAQGPHVST